MAVDQSATITPSTTIPIPSHWGLRMLESVCEGIFDCPHSTPILTEQGPYIARSQDIRFGVFRMEQAGRVSEETYLERITRAEPLPGDLLYSREGTYFGIAAAVPSGVRVCLGQRMVLLRPNQMLVEPRYLRYWLNSPAMVTHVNGLRDGSVAERLNLPTIRGLPVALPLLPEQRTIAHILGTLDDKIELNQRMSETLEAMARALFKSWFVDFDPVRAKIKDRWKKGESLPGLPAELWDVFPDRMVDSELGEIPEGWEVKPIGDLMELAYGKALKADDRHGGEVPVFGSNGQVGWHDQLLAPGPGIVVGRKGNPGIVTWAQTDFFVIDTAFYVTPKSASYSLRFLFHALREQNLSALGADSAVPGLNRNLAYMSPQVLPTTLLLERYDSVARALGECDYACCEESRTLSSLRDTLLPKLISGEIRVKDADKFVERAV